MPISVILRRLLLISLLALPQVYWLSIAWCCGASATRVLRWLLRLLIITAIVSMAVVLYDRIATKFLPDQISDRIGPAVQLWIFSSTFAFFLTMGLCGLVFCWTKLAQHVQSVGRKPTPDISRRKVLRQTASVLGGAPFVAAFYGYAYERLDFTIARNEIPIGNLPPSLDGLRIVQLSDIHVGASMPLLEIRRAVAMANELQPHLAVLTGDFVTSYGDPLEGCIHELSRLQAPLGTWGCNGNHEIYAGAEDDAESLFAASGMRLLRHQAAELQWNGASFNLIGIDYQHNIPITGKAMPTLNGAERLVRRDMPNILLSHNPNTFHSAAAAGVELSLSGHTHGGQVNVEILHTALNPARFVTSFIAGLYQLPLPDAARKQAFLYVNRGLGTLGFPARIGSKPEITLLTLRSTLNS